MTSKIAILVLAAGNSSRFGGCKLLALFKQKPLLSYALDAAKKLSAGNVFLLTGAWHETLLDYAQGTDFLDGVNVIHHENWAQGMGSSIAKGIELLAPNYDALMIMLADQPLISLADYQQLLAQLKLDTEEEQDISCSLYANKRGVPAMFNRSCFSRLKKLSGTQGAKALLYDTDFQIIKYNLATAAADIDLQEELITLNAAT